MTSLHKSLEKTNNIYISPYSITTIITLSFSPGSDCPLWVGSLMQRKGSGSEWHEAIWRGFTYLVETKTWWIYWNWKVQSLDNTFCPAVFLLYLETPNAILFLPFREKQTLNGKRCLLKLPSVFKPAPAILVCRVLWNSYPFFQPTSLPIILA